MFMADNKKKAATLIVGAMKPADMKEKPTNEMGDEVDASAGLMAAAEEIMSAVEKKDAKALMHAMKSFHAMCADESPEESEA